MNGEWLLMGIDYFILNDTYFSEICMDLIILR